MRSRVQGLRLTKDRDGITGPQKDYTHPLFLPRASCPAAKKISCQENYALAYHFPGNYCVDSDVRILTYVWKWV